MVGSCFCLEKNSNSPSASPSSLCALRENRSKPSLYFRWCGPRLSLFLCAFFCVKGRGGAGKKSNHFLLLNFCFALLNFVLINGLTQKRAGAEAEGDGLSQAVLDRRAESQEESLRFRPRRWSASHSFKAILLPSSPRAFASPPRKDSFPLFLPLFSLPFSLKSSPSISTNRRAKSSSSFAPSEISCGGRWRRCGEGTTVL
ncbi:hypothetical protein OPV22_002628 [Ensete ventricosum]|uniref:Transmembrane protein n=1 Tax=Ensete ventricosum TaxID=4639 RepID=A0AAV8RYI1_ENSVE|nr:hypothetical protein OPV22_002628 [Ensete ventricosum]